MGAIITENNNMYYTKTLWPKDTKSVVHVYTNKYNDFNELRSIAKKRVKAILHCANDRYGKAALFILKSKKKVVVTDARYHPNYGKTFNWYTKFLFIVETV